MQLGQGADAVRVDRRARRRRLTGSPGPRARPIVCPASRRSSPPSNSCSARREVGAIMVTDELSTDLLQRALRSGVKDVLQAPVDTAQLAMPWPEWRSVLLAPTAGARPPVDREVIAATASSGRVITVFSTKGGAGKSVIAANLAVLLAAAHRASRSCWSMPTCSSATSP